MPLGSSRSTERSKGVVPVRCFRMDAMSAGSAIGEVFAGGVIAARSSPSCCVKRMPPQFLRRNAFHSNPVRSKSIRMPAWRQPPDLTPADFRCQDPKLAEFLLSYCISVRYKSTKPALLPCAICYSESIETKNYYSFESERGRSLFGTFSVSMFIRHASRFRPHAAMS